MKRILSNPLTGFLFIIAGPILTLLWIYSFRIPESEISHAVLRKTIIGLALTSVIVSFASHIVLKKFIKGLLFSVILSELVCLFTFAYFALSDPVNRAKNLMWLPIMMLSVAAISLPMALSITYGCSIIVKAYLTQKGR